MKRFGPTTAVAGIDFTVAQGELFGFLGPNGAGKTTTINLLTGLARADEGLIRIAGIDISRHPKAAQHLIGVVPDESNLYPELTGFENLCFCGALYGMRKSGRERRARELLSWFGLEDAGNRSFAGYSRGMKRKLAIAAGIIHEPTILFLDEPTTGLEVTAARQICGLITQLNAQGVTVFMTTHYIEEAERLCRRVAFIVNGRIVRVDSVQNLLQPLQGRSGVLISVDADAQQACMVLARGNFSGLEYRATSQSVVRVEGLGSVRIGAIVRFLEEQGVDVREARLVRPSLEDVFVAVTGIEAARMH
ncbi:MAG: ABC transporter ATP-binding protein [Kiritimatiellia bacterium]